MARTKKERVKISKDTYNKGIQIFRYLLPYKWVFSVGFLLLALSSIVFMVFPIASGEFVNIAIGESTYDLDLDTLGLGLIIILVIQSLFSFFRVRIFAYVSENAMADVKKDLFSKLVSLPITFFDENKVGELVSRTTEDVNQIQSAISITLAEFLRQIIVLVVGISYIAITNGRLTFLMLATLPVVIVVAIFWGKKIKKLSKNRQEELANSNVVLEESLRNISIVKSFTNEWMEIQRFSKSLRNFVHQSLRLASNRGLFIAFIIAIVFGVIFYVIYAGAKMVEAGEMPAGDLVSFIAVTGIIGASIGSLGDFYTNLLKAIGASERVLDLIGLDAEAPIKDNSTQADININGAVAFNDVAFEYPTRSDVPVLRGVNFDVAPGSTVAFVGQSGAGKSTIIQLLMKLYDIKAGSITLDGKNINEYDLQQLRSQMAVVPQEVLLFGGSIRENIAYANPAASEEAILAAAKKANALEFIEKFPEGLETLVGDRGVKLSGGQRQRIAIARAILKDPKILILDEATSSLDAESERLVQEALDTLMEGRTSIVIAHRLATIKNVDNIYVLDNGKIIESGTHSELAQKENGAYNNLAKLQFESV